jgi:hypothetical protein
MKRHDIKKINITLNKNRDDIELGEETINVTTENGVRLKIPYENTEIEKTDSKVSLPKRLQSFIMNRKKG